MSEPTLEDPSADGSEAYDGATFYAGLAGDADSEADLAWIDDDRTPEEQRHSNFLDVYANSWEETLLPDEQAEFDVWLAGLEPAEREQLEATRAEIAQAQLDHETRTTPVEAQLRATAPELFTGRLSNELASRLDRPYVLGLNQSGETSTASQAAEYLREAGGLDLRASSPNQRFLFIDERIAREAEAATEHALVEGYYSNPEWGRFVFAFPVDASEEEPLARAQAGDETALPEDFFVLARGSTLHGEQDTAINGKYCAGFIDSGGRFNPNAQFMRGSEVAF